MTDDNALSDLIDYISLEIKRLQGMFKIYWLVILMGAASICVYVYGYSQASALADYSEEITRTVSPETAEDFLVVVDAKVDLLRTELKLTQNYSSLYLGGIFIGAGISLLLAHKKQLKKMELMVDAIRHLQQNT